MNRAKTKSNNQALHLKQALAKAKSQIKQYTKNADLLSDLEKMRKIDRLDEKSK